MDNMYTIFSLVTSVKDYIEVVHKLIETSSSDNYLVQSPISNYNELGSILTYTFITLKNSMADFFSLKLSNWNLPILIPEVSSAMISEVSVLDGNIHNSFNLLDLDLSAKYGQQNGIVYGFEKLVIGLINSCFFIIPTSTAHIITLRRFVMQGLEAGYIAGLGTIAGNIFWIGSIVLGLRFFVIPWLSFDIFRYVLGFMLLIKYMWDSYTTAGQNRMVLEDLNKQKIFLLNFLLALTEQSSLYPFITNLSIGPDSSILESFPAENYSQFIFIHFCYLLGLVLGSLSLLHLTCWFMENPAFKIYMWAISSFKVSTSFYYKLLNFGFLYLTMICAMTSIPYYGLDYTITNPLGFVYDDRLLDSSPSGGKALIPETAFINAKASDKNTRRNRGRHGRRERWKRRIRKYRTFDASLYDNGVYDLFTIEDLNYGFDRFWLRRKMRNHRVRFRFFPGPWMRSFKKQLIKKGVESYAGPRQEFFRILFEQVYHPSFHKYNTKTGLTRGNLVGNNPKGLIFRRNSDSSSNSIAKGNALKGTASTSKALTPSFIPNNLGSSSYSLSQNKTNLYSSKNLVNYKVQNSLISENSTLRKFVRKVNNRIKASEIISVWGTTPMLNSSNSVTNLKLNTGLRETTSIFKGDLTTRSNFGEALKNASINHLFSEIYSGNTAKIKPYYMVSGPSSLGGALGYSVGGTLGYSVGLGTNVAGQANKKAIFQPSNTETNLSAAVGRSGNKSLTSLNVDKGQLLHPLKFYLKKQQAFERKLRYYTPTVFRKFSIENNAPYFRVMMKRFFYYYKPTSRWEKTMKVASLRKARRKTSRIPRKMINYTGPSLNNEASLSTNVASSSIPNTNQDSSLQSNLNSFALGIGKANTVMMQQPTHNYTVVGKRASRYRYQIYKDVLQHWYYSPFNRFLLKVDVDSFIRRQPKSHFLTKNEENNLHLKRFLLYEHYNTLRWYTYMQHYRSMKNKIGGTKSFSSNIYNQQFMGTFKKIRHLFAITPSQNNKTILKFDTPLFNNNSAEYYGLSNFGGENQLKNQSLIGDSGSSALLHEELLSQKASSPAQRALATGLLQPLESPASLPFQGEQSLNLGNSTQGSSFNDLVGQSTFVVRDYLKTATPIREKIIQKLIVEKNYSELTNFLYNGQKTRGMKPVTNDKDLNNQEFNYLFSLTEQDSVNKQLNSLEVVPVNNYKKLLENKTYKQDLWVSLLKKWKHSVNDGALLKNYISRRVDKREKRKQKKEKSLRAKLAKLNTWLVDTTNMEMSLGGTLGGTLRVSPLGLGGINTNLDSSYNTLSSGSIKAIKDGMETLTSSQVNLTDGVPYSNLQNSLVLSAQVKKEKEIVTSLKTINNIYNDLNNSQQLNEKISKNLNSYLRKISQISLGYKTKLQEYLQIQKVFSLFSPLKRNTLNKEFWRKRERALNKQKKSRKEFKNLGIKSSISKGDIKYKNDYYFSSQNNQLTSGTQENQTLPLTQGTEGSNLRKKRDQSASLEATNNSPMQFNEVYNSVYKNPSDSTQALNRERAGISSLRNSVKSIFTKQFKRKKSPQRRARIRRNRSVIRKSTLATLLKRKFKKIQNNSASFENGSSLYEPKGQKQRQTKIRKRRVWKDKRAKFSKKQSKYRKHRRNALGKIRILNKQLKRIESTTYVKNWWWNTFLPSIRANTDALWQIEKEQLMKEKLQELTESEILKRDRASFTNTLSQTTNSSNVGATELQNANYLQIGNKDFKPLSLPLAIQLKENLLQKDILPVEQTGISATHNPSSSNLSVTDKLYTNLLLDNNNMNLLKTSEINVQGPFLTSNTSIPFYAGWDESLRKFVVTNRLLSRRQAGFGFDSQLFNTSSNKSSSSKDQGVDENKFIEFTSAPLKGMNAPTTLYWQIPFTTYDPDQFYALGMDGFAPIGWRRFNFRHTILKSWLYYLSSPESKMGSLPKNIIVSDQETTPSSNKPILVKGKSSIRGVKTTEGVPYNSLIYKLNQKNNFISNPSYFGDNRSTTAAGFSHFLNDNSYSSNKNKKNLSRRLKKRLKRVKRHPRAPVWFPSGPLLNQVLPVHYIYVFYKRSRVPRDRYIKRRLQKQSTLKGYGDNPRFMDPKLTAQMGGLNTVDFTLRKRVKTKRKYHRKKENISLRPIPKRIKFYGYQTSTTGHGVPYTSGKEYLSRPIKLARKKIPIAEIVREQRLTRTKQSKSSKNKQPSMRVKQLRRRVQQQIIRSVWRYRPRAGGFVWPGDYLRLELVKAPKLNLTTSTSLTPEKTLNEQPKDLAIGSQRKMKRKKKRAIKEWQIQPKNYLLEKHNIRVLKKKLQKANHSNKIKQRLKELNYIV